MAYVHNATVSWIMSHYTRTMRLWEQFWHRYLGRPYRLHVTEHSSEGPTLILLHGIAASSDKWNELIPLIKDSYRCITIDLLGFGKSPKPQWLAYTMEDHLHSLHKTLASLGLHEDYILMGHSLGSLLATRYAREHPQHVSQLVLLSSPIYPPLEEITGRINRRRTALLLKIYEFLRSNPRVTPANVKRFGKLLPIPKSIVKHPATWVPFMRTLEHCIEQQTILQDIVDISVPIDMFYGTLDSVVVPYNLQSISKITDVQLHQVTSNHDVGKRYAKAVAEWLLASSA